MKEDEWKERYPIIRQLQNMEECLWINDKKITVAEAEASCRLKMEDILEASDRWNRFTSYIRKAFPETESTGGMIESPLRFIPHMKDALSKEADMDLPGKLMLKCDNLLPISGSIKARGGIYEVLKYAEELALKNHMLTLEDDYSVLTKPTFRELFSKYRIAVGSTGNLGLSIGIISARFGLDVTVHMSADARQWKKDMLRSLGVNVIEYTGDYSKAVSEGRRQAQNDPDCHFVDDEDSEDLFLGYSVAALRLKKQLDEADIPVDHEHPLFLYLPCGVGGGPGGVSFGLKMIYGDNVHCFFAEPTHSPSMLLGLATSFYDKICVQDFGIDNRTAADGLAVGRCSRLVAPLLHPYISGSYTVSDEHMYRLLAEMMDTEEIRLEPSALAGVPGILKILNTEAGKSYLRKSGVEPYKNNITHIAWATGGGMVPGMVMEDYYKKGKFQN
ncbi:MAG: D-serine ammonia-lyase [Clostridiales bacterium]|nr:D-serine ammonia-lyase [Clostridiales bacterium]